MPHLKTTNVFIDTQAFDAAKLNFESTAIKELMRLAQAGHVKVFLTTITKSEIVAHISQHIHEAFILFEKFRDKGRMLKNVAAFTSVFATFDEKKAVAEVEKKFERFLAKAHVTIFDLEDADAEAVFEDYFGKKPPFGEGKKKHEFPDAFAQQILIRHCNRNDCKMYVVSADGDWESAGDPLIPLAQLRDFIDAAVRDEAEALWEKPLRIFGDKLDEMEAAVERAFKDCGFYTDDVDGDVNEVKVKRLELPQLRLLEVNRESATISVSVDLDYEADVSYEDDDGGIWDSEDHVWLFRPTKYMRVEESAKFDAELSIQFSRNKDQLLDVSCSIGRDFSVTVLPSDYDLK